MTTIKLKNGSGAPTAGDLVQGEPALDLTNKRLYTEDSGGTVIEVGTNPGASGAVTLNYSGSAKLATTTTGIDVTGNIALSSAGSRRIDISNTSLANTGEMVSLQWDANADLTFQGRASDGTFKANWYRIEADASDGLADAHRFYTDSSVERMNITSTGVDVTGTVTADDVTVSGTTPVLSLIDTDGTNQLLQLQEAAGAGYIDVRNNVSYANLFFRRVNGTNTLTTMRIKDNGDTVLYADDGTTQAFYWDASLSRLGLGTTSPSTDLHIASSNPVIRLEDTDGAGVGTSQIQNTASGNLRLMADSNNTAASSTIEFEVDGTEHMRIDGSGQVGIGTTNPGVALDVVGTTDTTIRVYSSGTGTSDDTILRSQVAGTTASNYLYFGDADDNNAGQIRYVHSDDSMRFYAGATTERLRLYSTSTIFYNGGTEIGRFASNNNFGIGTSSPAYAIEIEGASKEFRITDTGANSTYARVATATNSATMQVGRQGANFSVGSLVAKGNGSYLALDNVVSRVGVIESESNGDLSFSIDDGTTDTEFMRLDYSSGNVGIGLTNPTAPFTVNGNSNGLLAEFGGNNTVPTRRLQLNEYAVSGINNSGFEFNAPGAGGFAAISFATLGSEAMRIDEGGRVGIATTDPQTALHVDSSTTVSAITLRNTSGTAGLDLVTSGTGGFLYQRNNDALVFGTNNTEVARFLATGDFLINTTGTGSSNTDGFVAANYSGGSYADIGHNGAASNGDSYVAFRRNGTLLGSITQVSSTGVAYNTTSDQRLKDNIVDAPSASDDIDAIQVRSFDWKADGSHQKYGMVAQELQTVAPDAVTEGDTEEDMMSVDYSKLVPMLVKEIQSLRARVAQLEGAN